MDLLESGKRFFRHIFKQMRDDNKEMLAELCPITLPTSYIERMENELSGITGKLEKLKAFFTTESGNY